MCWRGLLLLAVILSGGCGRGDVSADRADRSRRPAAGATVETILAQPYEHFGDKVTVYAGVKRLLGSGAFTILTADRRRELLVIAGEQTQGAIPRIAPEDSVRVDGTVREFDREAISEETWSTLNEATARQWTGQPAILARQIEILPD